MKNFISINLKDSKLVFRDDELGVIIFNDDSFHLMDELIAEYKDGLFDMIFADPPYFLSNGGITCYAGKMVKVDKGNWDKSKGLEENHKFNFEWLSRCQKLLKPNGTIWVTGTYHNIYSIGFAMQQLGMKILNDISWEKPNPPPNLSRRYFTHSTETIIWAAKDENSKHIFNYDYIKSLNHGKQMKTVWKIPAPSTNEKSFGKHPTQKPIKLLELIILASTNQNALIFDPFLGSGTTAVASIKLNRRVVGCEIDKQYLEIAIKRIKAEINNIKQMPKFISGNY
ncbi:MAG: site-specific DNA-methyltransferase [Ignavibacteria bacterium]|jgi:site-specific DNA-methyltransferase (adenine-specific)|nr:site-specific DNA-methyltransferase [Ignavibacteria bacterium]MDH7526553.1 site-specific DNA-methyltransferase [Ignavibacteria bacterium]